MQLVAGAGQLDRGVVPTVEKGPLEGCAEHIIHAHLGAGFRLVDMIEARPFTDLEHRPEAHRPAYLGGGARWEPLVETAKRLAVRVQPPGVVSVGCPVLRRDFEAALFKLDKTAGLTGLRVSGLVGGDPATGLGVVVSLQGGRGDAAPG
ncbi:hypothetical protein D9M68_789000 [compost metagenome]